MLYRRITQLLKLPLVHLSVIVIGSSIVTGCHEYKKTESLLEDPVISSELPPEAAVQYLNNVLSKTKFKYKCHNFTAQNAISHDGHMLSYTDSHAQIFISRGMLWESDSIFIMNTQCFGKWSYRCICLISNKVNNDSENLILTALHSLGLTELFIEK